MGQITTNRARVNKLLVNVSRRQNVEGLIFNKVLTPAFVKQHSGLIGNYDKGNLRIEHDIVGGRTPYPRVTASVKDSDEYSLEKHGLSGVITEEDKDNEEAPFDAKVDLTMELTDKIKLGTEDALAISLTSQSIFTNSKQKASGSTNGYKDFTNSNPLGDFTNARESIYDKTGKVVEMPGGFAIVPWPTFNVLKFHPDLIENIKHTVNMKAGLTFEQLASSMGVARILIPWGQKNTAKEGQTDVIANIWGDNIFFGYAPLTGTKRISSLGFKVQKRADVRVFTNIIDNPPNAEEILVDIEYDFLLTDLGAGFLIFDTLTT